MKPFMKNRDVERILSLIVILYGIRIILPEIADWLLSFFKHRGSVIYGFDPATCYVKILVGFFLIGCFPKVVAWIGYFATEGNDRPKRRWFAREIVAIPIIFIAFTELLFVLFNFVRGISGSMAYRSLDGIWDIEVRWLLMEFFLAVAAGILLLSARRISAWLMRIAAPQAKKFPHGEEWV